MKTLTRLLAITALLAGVQAYADPGNGCPNPQNPAPRALRCVNHDLATLSRSGYSYVVEFPLGELSTTAVLEEMAFSKEQQTRVIRRLAELPCRAPEARPNPDSTQLVLVCDDPRLSDAGYVIQLEGADLAGMQRAKVIERRFTGDLELAHLPCLR